MYAAYNPVFARFSLRITSDWGLGSSEAEGKDVG